MPLFVVATPIGNLSDCSPRAREVLEQADCIAAEDTRVTRKLLSALSIATPKLHRYSAHTERQSLTPLLSRIASGERVVLVSDAGTPCVSDPGEVLVRACHSEGLPVEIVPGPSAVAAALSASGLPATPHQFVGFPPRKKGPLERFVRELGAYAGTTVVYESPQRAAKFVDVVATVLPDREVCLCREISKMHEEILLLPALEMTQELGGRDTIKGEVVFVIGPGDPPAQETEEPVGTRLKEIAAALAQRWGCTKKEAYERLLQIESERD